jgi:hypothetical protein
MTSPYTGNQVASDSDLPAIRESADVTTAETTASDPTARNAASAASSNLAEETVRERTERQNRDLLVGAGYLLTDRVSHPDGGDCSVEEILQYETAQRTQIDQELASGSRKHHRLPLWMRWIPKYVLGFDFCLLLYFFAGITDVNWVSPLSLPLAFATVLAAMVTVLSYGFLAFTGHRLRSHKNHAGTIHPEDLDGFTSASFGIAIVVVAVLAMLMFLRIRTEVVYALGAQAQITALMIAVAVAVVSAVANFLVIAVHGFDGSDQVARLDELSAAVRRPVARAHRMRQRAAKQVHR